MNLKKTFIRFKCNDFKSNFRLKTSVFGRSSPNEKNSFYRESEDNFRDSFWKTSRLFLKLASESVIKIVFNSN
ncbi:hypothetical protein LEP1GSC005_3831 [Leptospira santarosai str. ST188]|nr:hypothetical protein LEP1GSC005_3831 [Leptospira santarosai str. ST188]